MIACCIHRQQEAVVPAAAHLVCVVKLIIHEPCDDTCLANRLISQEHLFMVKAAKQCTNTCSLAWYLSTAAAVWLVSCTAKLITCSTTQVYTSGILTNLYLASGEGLEPAIAAQGAAGLQPASKLVACAHVRSLQRSSSPQWKS